MSLADKALLLAEECAHMQSAAAYLRYSVTRVEDLLPRLGTGLTPEELERFESLASRFARLADLLIQRVMRLVDELELLPSASILDRIQRAEKRGWVERADILARIRELRNLIAHEYAADQMAEIYTAVYQLSPDLDTIVGQVAGYTEPLLGRLRPSAP